LGDFSFTTRCVIDYFEQQLELHTVLHAQLPPVSHAQPLASQTQSSQAHASPQQEQGLDFAGPWKAARANGVAATPQATTNTNRIFLIILNSPN
jgi:hypothetical protein